MTTISLESGFNHYCPGSLDVRGIVRAQGFHQYSDIRLKTNMEDIMDALNIVSALHGKRYEWKNSNIQGLKGGKKVIGLIAQEVKRVLPEVVGEDENGLLSVNYADLIPILLEALKQHIKNYENDKKEFKQEMGELKIIVQDVKKEQEKTEREKRERERLESEKEQERLNKQLRTRKKRNRKIRSRKGTRKVKQAYEKVEENREQEKKGSSKQETTQESDKEEQKEKRKDTMESKTKELSKRDQETPIESKPHEGTDLEKNVKLKKEHRRERKEHLEVELQTLSVKKKKE